MRIKTILAAQQGHALAQNNLAAMYEYGVGAAKNLVIAYSLYNLAAAQDGTGTAKSTKNRNELLNQMTPAQVLQGQALTRQFLASNDFKKTLQQAEGKR